MNENFNLIRRILLFLQTYAKTRFGSGVIGFLLCLGIMYFGVVKNQITTIDSLNLDKADLQKDLKFCQNHITIIREEVRAEAREEQKVLFEYVYEMINKMRSEVDTKKVKVEKNIEQLEKQIVQKQKKL